ncbi:protein misato homolog 1 isoform X2 [Centruroides vittatus]|uniref:protein misato homolog 1 isoform X2 n=1 Tax=Centruroides vittatus TaxID=120091 RepID=UPI0035109CC7
MSSREVITLQIGNYSNFIGTHWWNSQESSFCYEKTDSQSLEINHDYLFREGENPRGEVTYTPRLMLIDLKENFKTLNKCGVLYNMPVTNSPMPLWHGKLSTFKSDSLSKNEFLQDLDKEEEIAYPDLSLKMTSIDEDRDICQAESSSSNSKLTESLEIPNRKFYDLDDRITTWSDFLKIHYHPRSLCFIEDYGCENEFNGYGCGVEVFNRENMYDLIDDTLRYFSEECDYLQGFHVLMDGYNGFTAIANGILEHLEDSYSSKIRLCFPVYNSDFTLWRKKKVSHNDICQYYSSLMGYNSLAMYSHLFSPLDTNSHLYSGNPNINFPYLNYKTEMNYHTSSVLSIALDTITLPMRMKSNAIHLNEMISSLTILGQKLIPLTLCTPIPVEEHSYLNDVLNSSNNVNLVPLTPCCNIEQFDIISQFINIRGLPKSKFFNHLKQNIKMTVEKVLGYFLQSKYPSSMNFWKICHEPYKTTAPFPHIFNSKINVRGYIGSSQRTVGTGVESISAISGFHNTKNASDSINVLLKSTDKSKLKNFSCKGTGVESDDFEEALENLKVLVDCYKDRQ